MSKKGECSFKEKKRANVTSGIQTMTRCLGAVTEKQIIRLSYFINKHCRYCCGKTGSAALAGGVLT